MIEQQLVLFHPETAAERDARDARLASARQVGVIAKTYLEQLPPHVRRVAEEETQRILEIVNQA